jgi:hypothetical protein
MIKPFLPLPAGFCYACDVSLECFHAEADATHLELTEESARTTADLAPVTVPDLELRLPHRLNDL